MPGKVNPRQCEAMVMVCIEVIGEDTAVAFAGSQGNFELNAMRRIIISNLLHSARLLGDPCYKFRRFAVHRIRLDLERIAEMLRRSLMLGLRSPLRSATTGRPSRTIRMARTSPSRRLRCAPERSMRSSTQRRWLARVSPETESRGAGTLALSADRIYHERHI
jgi:hypothetical protein